MTLIDKIKQLFKQPEKEKSKDALDMWDTLKDDYTGDPEFHPSLRIDTKLALSLDDKERNEYLLDLVRRRNEAHNRYR